MMKEKVSKELLGRTWKLLEIKLYSKNMIKGMNTWQSPFKVCQTLSKLNKIGTPKLGQENKEIDDNMQGLMHESWCQQIVYQKKVEDSPTLSVM